MSKPKFKVGDKVVVISSIMNHPKKIKNIGEVFKVKKVDDLAINFKYTLDNDRFGLAYSEKELELVKVTKDRTYTGIELLQAIKDGVFKDGDEFEVLYDGRLMDMAKVIKYGSGSTIRYEGGDIHGKVVGIQVIINKHVTFKPIKKEPINLAKVDKVLNMEIPVDILGKREFIDARVTIKGNKIVVKLPSGITGVASCCPEDKFDKQKGIRLASARAIKKQIINDLDKNIEGLVK